MNDVTYCHLCDEYSITEDGATVCWSCEMDQAGALLVDQATQLLIEGGLL